MAHLIEEFQDGTAAFFTNRQPAWHRLGTVTDGALTAEQALEVAHLDWHVHKTSDPIAAPITTDDGVHLIHLDDKFLTYRQHPKTGEYQALGVVGSQYQPIQNAEAFDFLNTLVDESGAHFETAGSLAGGRRVFMSMKFPETMQIGGQDPVDLYLLAWNSHDGLSAFNVIATPVRVVCQNTLTAGIRSAQASWSIRHTATATAKVQAARETLGLTFKYAEAFQKEAEALLAQEMKATEFTRFLESLVVMPKDATDRVKANVDATRDQISSLWTAPTQDNGAGTRWGAWNAVTEWADWVKPVKGADDPDLARARRIVTDLGGLDRASRPLDIKRKAWRLLADEKVLAAV